MAEPLSECLDILGELNSLLLGRRARVSLVESLFLSSAVWLAASAAQSSAVAKSLQPLGERY